MYPTGESTSQNVYFCTRQLTLEMERQDSILHDWAVYKERKILALAPSRKSLWFASETSTPIMREKENHRRNPKADHCRQMIGHILKRERSRVWSFDGRRSRGPSGDE